MVRAAVLFVLITVSTNIFHPCGGVQDDFKWGNPYLPTKGTCNTPDDIKEQIAEYKTAADQILELVRKGSFKGQMYKDLELLVDTTGYRLSGSPAYNEGIDQMKAEMAKMGLANIREEPVSFPNWQRGDEVAFMLKPRNRSIGIIGMTHSTPTPPDGITAEIIVIPSFEFMESHPNDIVGKIALFDLKGINKRDFRIKGGQKAYEAKAVAALGRSMVSKSVYSLGARSYRDNDKHPIPIASIANEDVDLLVRMSERGSTVVLHLKLLSNVTELSARNLIGDYQGRDGEVVLLTGHMDSFDVSQGAQDNGCGVILAMNVVKVLQQLKLKPRRSLRVLLTAANEFNYLGTKHYLTSHSAELGTHTSMLVADNGCGRPMGYIFYEKFPKMGCLLFEVSLLFDTTLTLLATNQSFTSGDAFTEANLAAALMNGDDGRYYWIRHTYADTMSHVDSRDLDQILGFWATTAYVLADMPKLKELLQ